MSTFMSDSACLKKGYQCELSKTFTQIKVLKYGGLLETKPLIYVTFPTLKNCVHLFSEFVRDSWVCFCFEILGKIKIDT